MTVQKGEMQYRIEEQENGWKIEAVNGKLTVCYKLTKEDYPTFEDVRRCILQDDMF